LSRHFVLCSFSSAHMQAQLTSVAPKCAPRAKIAPKLRAQNRKFSTSKIRRPK
jgi:hypothetical protein